MAAINEIMNAYEDAQEASEYADALVMDEEQIEGTDYRLIISGSYSGNYPPTK
jgi:hypothetical protein